MMTAGSDTGDSDELQNLFDQVASEKQWEHAPAPTVVTTTSALDPKQDMYAHIGHLTRQLHDAMRELGFDQALQKVAGSIPDTRDRLGYIATLTENAAERVLNAVDAAMPLQDSLQKRAEHLGKMWQRLVDKQLAKDEFETLVVETRAYLLAAKTDGKEISSRLHDIMMAQDFQDLTGQVIKKILSMAHDMESHLVEFLVEFAPQSRTETVGQLSGPVIGSEVQADVVTDQQQVDDLLSSLGF